MLRAASLLLLILALSGCKAWAWLAKPSPVQAFCPKECDTPCEVLDPFPLRADGSADALERWAEKAVIVHQVNGKQQEACETKRNTCAQCINRLKAAGVIE